MVMHYKLESFEGPLDLLLHLIEKAEVDIYDIPISEITNQYMEYISRMGVLELGPTSEFLVMAATLLSIKSKMLLPKPPADSETDVLEEEEDPRAELVERLLEYRKYKWIAEHLRDQELARSLIYSREPTDLSPYIPDIAENPLLGIQLEDLVKALQKVLQRTSERNRVAKVQRDEISVQDRIQEVITYLKQHGKALFSTLFSDHRSRVQIVVTFLAILELTRRKYVSCYQHRIFDDIVIEYRNEGEADGIPADEIRY